MKIANDLFSLKGKVVLVTGAGGLLGSQHCEAIASYGGTPILLDLSLDLVQDLADNLNSKYNVSASCYAVDITDENSIKKNEKSLLKKYGRIDALINNAANNPAVGLEDDSGEFSRLENFPLNQWIDDLSVGLTGAFLCCKHYGYAISKNPNGGVIINISSDLGLISPDQRLYEKKNISKEDQITKPVSYSVAKTGLLGLTRYVSTYWGEENVRCNAICPGGVENRQSKDFLKNVSSRIPLNRLAKLDEYKSTIVYLLSDTSSYLNGAIIPIDGGRTAW
jgi:NAD(P)-dependent dehydrogenase (short-subunit alcohol dehydrogenase family)